MVSLLTENILKEEMEKSAIPSGERFYVKNKNGKTIHYNLSEKAKREQEQKAKDALGGVAKTDDDDND